MSKAPFILLINPWITDFAAYDLWAKPMGLLLLASMLREGGCGVALVDCLDRHDPFTLSAPDILPGADRPFGTGKYPRMHLPKPPVYETIPRQYYRYGINPESFRKQLQELPKPDFIWITSMMTYWYPGVQQTIAVLKEAFPGPLVWLGGIYARLCPDHARRTSGADEVVTVPPGALPGRIASASGYRLHNEPRWERLDAFYSPALDLVPHLAYVPILTSRGCPFRCPYCASGTLQPTWDRRSADDLYREMLRAHEQYGLRDFAFYDDALLMNADATLRPALEQIAESGLPLRFHTPNALHIRALTPEWCRLLRASGFHTIRLGLETTRPERQREWGAKVRTEMFFSAVANLREVGYTADQIGVYLLCGAPGQTPEEVAEAIHVVKQAGAQPHLAEYSPVPGTAAWPQARLLSTYDLEAEPLYHNNTCFACRRTGFSYQDLLGLKALARRARHDGPGREEEGN